MSVSTQQSTSLIGVYDESTGMAALRPKNQLTIPKSIVEALNLDVGDQLLFVVDDAQGGAVHIIRLPKSFAGLAPDAYGTESSTEYVRGERASWGA